MEKARDGPLTAGVTAEEIGNDDCVEPVWLLDHYANWRPNDDDDPTDFSEGDNDGTRSSQA